MLLTILAFGQTSAITQEEQGPGGKEVARASGAVPTEEPALAPPATPAASMLAMEERLNWMEENLRAYQDEVQRLRSEIRTLKVRFAIEPVPEDSLEVAETAPPYLTAAVSTIAAEPGVAVLSSTVADPGPTAPALQTPGPATGMERMVESIMPGLKMSGVIWLYDYKPFSLPGTRSNFDLYGLHLKLDREVGPVGFHVEYRMRTTKLRSFFPSPT